MFVCSKINNSYKMDEGSFVMSLSPNPSLKPTYTIPYPSSQTVNKPAKSPRTKKPLVVLAHAEATTWRQMIGSSGLVGIHSNTPINNTSHSHLFLSLLSLSLSLTHTITNTLPSLSSLFSWLSLSRLCFFPAKEAPNSTPIPLQFPLKLSATLSAMQDLSFECNFEW